jgi:hypothetical protein
VKKPLAALLLSAASVAALAVPAGAATVSKTPPTATLHCGNRTARIWNTGTFVAGDNRCAKQWLILSYVVASQTNGGTIDRSVAPGAYFRHDGWDMTNEQQGTLSLRLASGPACGGEVYRKHSHGKPSSGPC